MLDWFLVGEDFAFFTDIVAEWLAYGIGLGAVVWIIGQAVALIYRLLRF